MNVLKILLHVREFSAGDLVRDFMGAASATVIVIVVLTIKNTVGRLKLRRHRK